MTTAISANFESRPRACRSRPPKKSARWNQGVRMQISKVATKLNDWYTAKATSAPYSPSWMVNAQVTTSEIRLPKMLAST
ncbi:hypothetical protein D3C81_1208360 [compost metagenome]